MKESKVRSKLVKALKARGCAAWPVENAVAVGMPDVYGITCGIPFWIELKVMRTKYRGLISTMTGSAVMQAIKRVNKASWKRQAIWRQTYDSAGGRDVYIFVINADSIKDNKITPMGDYSLSTWNFLQGGVKAL